MKPHAHQPVKPLFLVQSPLIITSLDQTSETLAKPRHETGKASLNISYSPAEWAFANVLSRTFETRVLLGDSEEGAESAMIMMLPFADMINHSPHNQVTSAQPSGGAFPLRGRVQMQSVCAITVPFRGDAGVDTLHFQKRTNLPTPPLGEAPSLWPQERQPPQSKGCLVFAKNMAGWRFRQRSQASSHLGSANQVRHPALVPPDTYPAPVPLQSRGDTPVFCDLKILDILENFFPGCSHRIFEPRNDLLRRHPTGSVFSTRIFCKRQWDCTLIRRFLFLGKSDFKKGPDFLTRWNGFCRWCGS